MPNEETEKDRLFKPKVDNSFFDKFLANDCQGKDYDSCVNSPCPYSSNGGCTHPKHPKNRKEE